MTSSASSGTHNGVLTRMFLEMRDSGGILHGNRYVHYLFRGGYLIRPLFGQKFLCGRRRPPDRATAVSNRPTDPPGMAPTGFALTFGLGGVSTSNVAIFGDLY